VSCELARTVVHAYLDGELDAVRAAEFERHLEQCAECVSGLEAEEKLSSALQRSQLYEKAPAELREKIVAATRAPATKVVAMTPRRVMAWRALAAAAAILLMAYVGWRVVPGLRGDNYAAVLASQVVDAHLRSLQPGHAMDVVSTDQHTVKPWFDGKLEFAPQVQDFASVGFPLQGGRLDVVHGRTVAALIYGRRKHVISVFVWPMREHDEALGSGAEQGYHYVAWHAAGMEYCAVSDVSAGDLEQLQKLFTQQ
jgi:anti-sigma factor (TIGR02949 family)